MRYAVAAALAAVFMAGPARAEGDPAAGKTVFVKCMACHSAKPGENKIGPTLFGIVGRPSHSVSGFAYSEPMKAHNVTWDEATLNTYLTDPRKVVPGTKMIFPGIKDEKERANVIAYLATLK